MSVSFHWRDFHALADEWARSLAPEVPLLEARCRCIVSRAYYGTLLTCRDHARATSRPLPASGSSHDDVIRWFSRGATDTHREIAKNLDRLRVARRDADYQTRWRCNKPQRAADHALFHANRIYNDIGSLDEET